MSCQHTVNINSGSETTQHVYDYIEYPSRSNFKLLGASLKGSRQVPTPPPIRFAIVTIHNFLCNPTSVCGPGAGFQAQVPFSERYHRRLQVLIKND